MKKQVLIAAVGAALAAGPMVASAGATVFGHFHMSVDVQDADGTDTATLKSEKTYISSNSSRVGVKGDEALGGGMKAIYQFELPFNADTNGTLTNTRSSWLGMSTMLGDIKLGKHDSPYKSIGRAIDPFNERIGDSRNVNTVFGAANSGVEGGFLNNAVVYESPTFAGVKVSAIYGKGEGFTAQESVGGVGVTWNWGGLFVGGAYGSNSSGAAGPESETGIRLAARYAFGFGLSLFGMYETVSDIGGAAGVDADVYGVGASFKFGNNSVHGQWYTADPSAANVGGDMYAVAYDYNFSKTTRVYAAYAQTSNDSGTARYIPAGAGHGNKFDSNTQVAVGPGTSPKAYSIGMILDF